MKTRKRTWADLNARTGGLSAPSKMPCHGWSIPADRCAMGSILRKLEGSTCRGCYALKGRYVFPNVQDALERRLQAWKDDRAGWRDAMVESILKTGRPFFRWFDSGDLQGVEMLEDIAAVAWRTPGVSHWLPTREKAIVRACAGAIPSNLTVRLSAPMVGESIRPQGSLEGIPTSAVHRDDVPSGAHRCPAPEQSGKCGDCRACWNPEVREVSYHVH